MAILFDRSDYSQGLVADLIKVSVSGYIGYMQGRLQGGAPR